MQRWRYLDNRWPCPSLSGYFLEISGAWTTYALPQVFRLLSLSKLTDHDRDAQRRRSGSPKCCHSDHGVRLIRVNDGSDFGL